MFTIKVIKNDVEEIVLQAKWISYDKKNNEILFHNNEYESLACCYSVDYIEKNTIKSGNVYIMNEQGKTVASYFLDVPRE